MKTKTSKFKPNQQTVTSINNGLKDSSISITKIPSNNNHQIMAKINSPLRYDAGELNSPSIKG